MSVVTASLPWAWAIEVVREDDSPVGQCEVTPDWEPWREWVRWLALRAGQAPADSFTAPCDLAPAWDTEQGPPRLRGVRVRTASAEEEFALEPFREPARTTIAAMVNDGRLGAGDLVRWRALAFVRDDPATQQPAPVGRSAPPPIPVRAERLSAGVGEDGPGHAPVLLPARVLAEVGALTLGSSGRETGGILIGHLCRDEERATVFARITAQVPARHTEAGETRLTFTPATWTEVRSAIDLRCRDEIMLGWWHSHPVRSWCRKCPEERRADCALARGFLSEDDRLLHRTVFPRAYSVALVASDVSDEGPEFTLFGWRRGLLEPRDFTRTGMETDDPA